MFDPLNSITIALTNFFNFK